MTHPDISIGSWFAARAARSPHRRALTFEGVTLTYGRLQERIDRLAADLRSGGVRHGDRVAFLGSNQPAFLETLIACARLGAAFVPLNFRLAGPELAFIVGDADVHTLVVDADHQAVIDEVRADLPVRRYIRVEGAAPGWESYEALIDGADVLTEPAAVDADDIAVLMYTSGTTGLPKGVILSHANLWWNNVNLTSLFDVLENDVTLVAAPLFHIAGLNVTTFTTWFKGGEVVLMRSFDAEACLDTIERLSITTMFGVPAIFRSMSLSPRFEDMDLTSLRMTICGGAPVPESLLRLYADRGIAMLQGYGLTETAPSATFLVAEHALSKLGSAGLPPIFTEVRIVTADGDPVTEPFARGEICVRGPNVTRGYWNRPEETARAIDPDGWFHTGDIGYRDDDGFMFIVDRIKDMVVSGGENVYPAEVENVLSAHPSVTEVAVIGMPDERWGETVTAVATVREGAGVTLDDLRDFGAGRLARYKLPTRLHVLGELPRNPSGKILKYRLREQLLTGDSPESER